MRGHVSLTRCTTLCGKCVLRRSCRRGATTSAPSTACTPMAALHAMLHIGSKFADQVPAFCRGPTTWSYLVYLRVVGPRLQGPRWALCAVLVDLCPMLLRYMKLLTARVLSTAPTVCCNTGATRCLARLLTSWKSDSRSTSSCYLDLQLRASG